MHPPSLSDSSQVKRNNESCYVNLTVGSVAAPAYQTNYPVVQYPLPNILVERSWRMGGVTGRGPPALSVE